MHLQLTPLLPLTTTTTTTFFLSRFEFLNGPKLAAAFSTH